MANQRVSETKSHSLEIGGMSCAACVGNVKNALEAIEGVLRSEIGLASGTAMVETSPQVDSMQLIRSVEEAGYRARILGASGPDAPRDMESEESPIAFRRLLLSCLLTVIVFASDRLGDPASKIVAALFSLLVLVFPGRYFFEQAYRSLKLRQTTMDTLVALGAGTAWLASSAAVLGWLGSTSRLHYPMATLLVTFILFGKWLEVSAKRRARRAMLDLLDLAPPTARRITPEGEEVIPAVELKGRDRVVVLAGEKIPADGIVRKGSTHVDESMLTGESRPRIRNRWDEVVGGTLNIDGRVEVEITASGEKSVLASIIRRVREAQSRTAPVQRLADRVSGIFVPVVLLLALITLVSWMFIGGGWSEAILHATAVVVVACPCALGLATPVAVLVASSVALRHGILIRGGAALESLGRVSSLLLDKTGTLTVGKLEVKAILPVDGRSTDEVLKWAAAAESSSVHPLAKAILHHHTSGGGRLPNVDGSREDRGEGIVATVEGHTVVAGSIEFLGRQGIDLSSPTDGKLEATSNRTEVAVALDGDLIGVIHLEDRIRDDAAFVVSRFQGLGIEVILVSGDRDGAVRSTAKDLGIERWHAGVLPPNKQELVEKLQEEGKLVAMAGDGINDAPALAAADCGIAIGSGTDAAKETGDIILMRSELSDLLRARQLAEITLHRIRENLLWAFGYNIVAIPAASGLLAPFGIGLPPHWAALAMGLSSVAVVSNSLRLTRENTRIFGRVSTQG